MEKRRGKSECTVGTFEKERYETDGFRYSSNGSKYFVTQKKKQNG